MSDSTRQSIMEALDTRLKTIKTTAGYKTNAGTNVFDWLDRDLADTELDAIIYRDKSGSRAQVSMSGKTRNSIMVEIEVKTKQSTGTAARVRNILEDVMKSVGTDEKFTSLCSITKPGDDEIDIQQAEKTIGSGRITINIEYETEKWSF